MCKAAWFRWSWFHSSLVIRPRTGLGARFASCCNRVTAALSAAKPSSIEVGPGQSDFSASAGSLNPARMGPASSFFFIKPTIRRMYQATLRSDPSIDSFMVLAR